MSGTTKHEGILSGYFQQFLSFIFSGLEEHASGLLERFFQFRNLKKQIRRYALFLAVLVTASIIFLNGLGMFLSSFFPAMAPGVIPMVIGFIFIMAALAFKTLS